MKRKLQISPSALQHKTYRHESKAIVATKEMMMKNSSESTIKMTYLQKNEMEGGHVFSLETLSEKFGKDSATEKLSRDMNSLIQQVTVGTNTQGKLVKILDKHLVVDKWKGLKKKWLGDAEEEEKPQINRTIAIVEENLTNGTFENDIANQGMLYFLFPGLQGNYDAKERTIERKLNKFLVTQPLPLKITYTIVQEEGSKKNLVIEGIGEVDEEKLDRKVLTKLIRTIKDQINLKVSLQVDYKERFEFDKNHWLHSSVQHVKVKIPGFYMTESKQEINQIQDNGQ